MNSYRDNQVDGSLREAIYSLPEIYRQVVMLYYFGGMNTGEIAKALGTSPTTIRKRLSRARSQLKEEMVAMIGTGFEGHRLQASFTFRVVEAVRRIKINPMPRVAGLPWGLSLAAGIIITVLGLNPHLNISSDVAIPAGSPLPVEVRVLKTREVPVYILKTDEISVIASKQGNGDGGKPHLQEMHNVFMLAPKQDEGGTWTRKADMPTARRMVATCVVDGRIYAIAGVNPAFSTVEVYDPETDTWARKADMPTERVLEKAASVVNGKIYAIGGFRSGEIFSTVEEYDPERDTWTKKAKMPTARGHATACAANGRIYAIGGCNQGPDYPGLSTVEEYDPATDTWTRKADMPTPRCSLDTVALNGRIYAIGGIANWANGPCLSTVEEYDPVKDTWTKKANMSAKRLGVSTAVVNGKIYAIGGTENPKGRHPDIFRPPEVYDPATNTWTELADMQIPRLWLSSSAVNGKIYAIGGSLQTDFEADNPDSVSSVVEEFTPEGWRAVSPRGKLTTTWGETRSR
jgi:N-acetylneuraminic acid mutarotase